MHTGSQSVTKTKWKKMLKFWYHLGPSPRDWRTMIHWNVVPTIFHSDHISQGLWKIVRTTFQCSVVLQLQGEGPEKSENYGADLPLWVVWSPRYVSSFQLCIFSSWTFKSWQKALFLPQCILWHLALPMVSFLCSINEFIAEFDITDSVPHFF